jgi:hypothetical protein
MIKTLATATAILIATAASASAGSGVKVGVLSCHIEGGPGFILGSSKEIDCVYRGGGRKERYAGTIRKLGIDIGFTSDTSVSWAVFAPGKTKRGALEGYYSGASAEATVVVGLGANVLIGGFKKTLNLQPLSVQAQTGLNIAAGITGLRLDYVGR